MRDRLLQSGARPVIIHTMNMKVPEYCECLVKGKTNTKALLGLIGSCVGAALLLAASFLYADSLLGQGAGILAAGLVVLAVISARRISVEYEYCCTPEGIDIDVIYGKRKRKQVISLPTESITLVAPEANNTAMARARRIGRIGEYAGKAPEGRYLIFCSNAGDVSACRVTPNEKMLLFIKLRLKRELITA